MRRAPVLIALTALLVVAGCGAAGSPPPSGSSAAAGSSLATGSSAAAGSSLATGDQPPTWVRSDALWQSLAAGEPHPRVCEWLETSAARADHLVASATGRPDPFGSGRVFVVVLQGVFTADQGRTGPATSLYLVLGDDHEYLAQGSATSRIDLASLGHPHSYVPRLPAPGGLWGHTTVAGGPAPGDPRPITEAQVAIWRGDRVAPSGPPLMRVRSDQNGFFLADLAPGVYTLELVGSGSGWAAPVTATVVSGRPAAVGLSVDVP
jgi:hypothetical protein